jgi:hypothetical protein
VLLPGIKKKFFLGARAPLGVVACGTLAEALLRFHALYFLQMDGYPDNLFDFTVFIFVICPQIAKIKILQKFCGLQYHFAATLHCGDFHTSGFGS